MKIIHCFTSFNHLRSINKAIVIAIIDGIRKFEAYETGEYFVISNASLVMETEEVDECVSMNQFVDIATLNGWELTFRYE